MIMYPFLDLLERRHIFDY